MNPLQTTRTKRNLPHWF